MASDFPGAMTGDLRTRLASGGKPLLIHEQMSPLEGTLLFSAMLLQKQMNAQYQMTPAEYQANWSARHAGKPESPRVDRSKVTAAALNAALTAKKPIDLLQQASSTLSDLGITGGAK
jgi:hypothetical protein